MNEISCDMCMDLLPLVNDGVASEDSRKAVEQHIRECDSCRAFFEGEKIPQPEVEKALSRAMKKVQIFSRICLLAVVLLGICLCEFVFQGSSVFFLLVVFLIGWMLRAVSREETGWKRVLKRGIVILVSAALVTAMGWGANEVYGNPIAKKQAEKAILQYLEENYGELDLYIEDISYNMSATSYEAEICSYSSMDTRFGVSYEDGRGIYLDDYETRVGNKGNTAGRISRGYNEIALPVLKLVGLECDIYTDKAWLDLSGLELELDGQYDVLELAVQRGHLEITVGDETVTEQRAAELLLDIRQRMDAEGIPFYSIDFSLWNAKDPENPQSWAGARDGGAVELEGFLYEDIYEEGLVERICVANLDGESYHANGK